MWDVRLPVRGPSLLPFPFDPLTRSPRSPSPACPRLWITPQRLKHGPWQNLGLYVHLFWLCQERKYFECQVPSPKFDKKKKTFPDLSFVESKTLRYVRHNVNESRRWHRIIFVGVCCHLPTHTDPWLLWNKYFYSPPIWTYHRIKRWRTRFTFCLSFVHLFNYTINTKH